MAYYHTEVRDYYSDGSLSGKFYDAITHFDPSVSGDIDYYARHAPTHGRVLEFGSGSGRISKGLAAQGLEVLGIERSAQMFNFANRSVSPDLQDRLNFLHADARTVQLPFKYHLAIAPFYLFNHLTTKRDRASLLSNMAKHLLPGGKAILHTLPVGRVTDPNKVGPQSGMKINFSDLKERLEVTWIRRTINRADRLMNQDVEYEHFDENDGLIERSVERFSMTWFSDSAIRTMASKAGFSLQVIDTSFHQKPGAERIFVLALKE